MNLTRVRNFIISAALVVLAAFPARSIAQIQKDTTHWNDEELYADEDKSAPSFFSVGGGILGAYFTPNLSAFNTNVAQPFVGMNYRQEVWMVGGQGFVTLPWVKNLRLGFMGYSGTSVDCGCIDSVLPNKIDTVNRY